MTIDEQRKAAYESGRLAAWQGRVHRLPAYRDDPDLMSHWQRGALEQMDAMSAAAAKVPLTWPDQMKSGARAD